MSYCGNRFGAHDRIRSQHAQVGNVYGQVTRSNQTDRYDDGSWQIFVGVFELFSDVIECVPDIVCVKERF